MAKKKSSTPADKHSKSTRSTPKVTAKLSTPVTEPEQDFFVFKDGLFYPTIDIHNEAWLKTAALYWDSLSTIVPDGMEDIRENPTSTYFAGAGFLKPEIVSPDMEELHEVADECKTFLNSPEATRVLHPTHEERHSAIESAPIKIHHKKFMDGMVSHLQRFGAHHEGEWIILPRSVGSYYMTVLATHLSRVRGFSLVSHDVAAEPLANRSVRGDTTQLVPGAAAQALLATMVLQTVSITGSTEPKKILEFKEKHAKEVGVMRDAIRELVFPIKGKTDVALLQKHLQTVYSDKVMPSIEFLRGRLKDNRIACGYNNLKASTIVSASPSVLGTAMTIAGLGPLALVGGVGISILLSIGNCLLQKRELLRSSPYSYVLQAEKEFGTQQD